MKEKYNVSKKNIYLLWLHGCDYAPILQQKVLSSWIKHNSDWNIVKLDYNNVKEYGVNIDFIYHTNKKISPQALTDIIRVSLLKIWRYLGRFYVFILKTNK